MEGQLDPSSSPPHLSNSSPFSNRQMDFLVMEGPLNSELKPEEDHWEAGGNIRRAMLH